MSPNDQDQRPAPAQNPENQSEASAPVRCIAWLGVAGARFERYVEDKGYELAVIWGLILVLICKQAGVF